VKQDHVWPTPRNRRGSTFSSDHLHSFRTNMRNFAAPKHGAPRRASEWPGIDPVIQ
jgi:hypothetical protein